MPESVEIKNPSWREVPGTKLEGDQSEQYDSPAFVNVNAIKKNGNSLPKTTVRETRFLTDYPEKFERLIPLIQEIDKYKTNLLRLDLPQVK